jgi:predicted  nucleic acid-binding Zn ribbon protein
MDYIKIKFIPKTPIVNEDETVGLIWSYLSSLERNGQVYINYEVIKTRDYYTVFTSVPEKDALCEKYNNIYAAKDLKELKEIFKIRREFVGDNRNDFAFCDCAEKPPFYLLYETHLQEPSPVYCGNCGGFVPMYKFPFVKKTCIKTKCNCYDDEHFMINSWKHAYYCIDRLFMNCLVDGFTYKQMNSPNSALSKNGREICKCYENETGIPFYYDLLYYEQKRPDNCPVCGKVWKLETPLKFGYFTATHMCEDSRLMIINIFN